MHKYGRIKQKYLDMGIQETTKGYVYNKLQISKANKINTKFYYKTFCNSKIWVWANYNRKEYTYVCEYV